MQEDECVIFRHRYEDVPIDDIANRFSDFSDQSPRADKKEVG